MKLGEFDVPTTKACTLSLYPLNLILLPSSLSNQKGRCYSSAGFGSTCQFASSCRSVRMIALTVVCTLAHFSFVLLLLGVLLGPEDSS